MSYETPSVLLRLGLNNFWRFSSNKIINQTALYLMLKHWLWKRCKAIIYFNIIKKDSNYICTIIYYIYKSFLPKKKKKRFKKQRFKKRFGFVWYCAIKRVRPSFSGIIRKKHIKNFFFYKKLNFIPKKNIQKLKIFYLKKHIGNLLDSYASRYKRSKVFLLLKSRLDWDRFLKLRELYRGKIATPAFKRHKPVIRKRKKWWWYKRSRIAFPRKAIRRYWFFKKLRLHVPHRITKVRITRQHKILLNIKKKYRRRKKKSYKARPIRIFHKRILRRRILGGNLYLNYLNVRRVNKHLRKIVFRINNIIWYNQKKYRFYLYYSLLLSKLLWSIEILSDCIRKIFARTKWHRFFLKNFLRFWRIIKSDIHIYLVILGKFNGKMRAGKKFFRSGSYPRQTYYSLVDYTNINIITKYGTFGLKIWFSRHVFKTDIKLNLPKYRTECLE
jgi:hypothetical protein